MLSVNLKGTQYTAIHCICIKIYRMLWPHKIKGLHSKHTFIRLEMKCQRVELSSRKFKKKKIKKGNQEEPAEINSDNPAAQVIDRLIASVGIKDWYLGPQRELGFWVKAEITENGKRNRICLVYLTNSYGGEERRSLSWTAGAGCRRQWKVVALLCFACSERVLFQQPTPPPQEEKYQTTQRLIALFCFCSYIFFNSLTKMFLCGHGSWTMGNPPTQLDFLSLSQFISFDLGHHAF